MSDTSVKKEIMRKIQEHIDNGWSARDALPKGDPIGDVDEKQDPYVQGYKQWEKDTKNYNEMMKNRVLFPSSKNFDVGFEIKPKTQCCEKPNKYKNIVSKTLQFYSCKNCGADLGDI